MHMHGKTSVNFLLCFHSRLVLASGYCRYPPLSVPSSVCVDPGLVRMITLHLFKGPLLSVLSPSDLGSRGYLGVQRHSGYFRVIGELFWKLFCHTSLLKGYHFYKLPLGLCGLIDQILDGSRQCWPHQSRGPCSTPVWAHLSNI